MKRVIIAFGVALVLALGASEVPLRASFTVIFTGGTAGDGSNIDYAETSPVDTSGATFLGIVAHYYPGVVADMMCGDNYGNTYSLLGEQTSDDGVAKVQFYGTTSGTPFVGNLWVGGCSGTSSYTAVSYVAVSGNGAMPVDVVQGVAAGAGATSLGSGSFTPSQTNELVLTMFAAGDTPSLTNPSGYTNSYLSPWVGGVTMGGGLAYHTQTTATSTNPTWTWTGGTSSAATLAVSLKTGTPPARMTYYSMLYSFVLNTLSTTVIVTPPFSDDYHGYRPHYQGGYGTDTKGAWGGTIPPVNCHVNTLSDSGGSPSGSPPTGSLRQCLEGLSVPRVVVFDTSGTIPLSSRPIQFTSPYVTIAGQTAPSPGITLIHFGIYIDAHDVVIQHLRIREGTGGWTPTSTAPFQFYTLAASTHDVVVDHMSLGFAQYQTFEGTDYYSTGIQAYNISVLDTIVAFPLSHMGITSALTGYGMSMGHADTHLESHYGYARDLYVHSSYRDPLVGAGRQFIVNDVIVGSGPFDQNVDQTWGMQMWWPHQYYEYVNANPLHNTETAIVNTVSYSTYGTGDAGDTLGSGQFQHTFSFAISQNNLDYQQNHVLIRGNLGPGITGATLPGQKNGIDWVTTDRCGDSGTACGLVAPNADIFYPAGDPSWYTDLGLREVAPTDTMTYVTTNAGARPTERDAVDIAAVNQTRAAAIHDLPNMGRRLRSETELGGYPTVAVNVSAFVPVSLPNSNGTCGTWAGGQQRPREACQLEDLARSFEPQTGVPAP